ncbi:DUF2301 domain-containing membrane protein [Vibrio sp. SS-MA-C1-2]|uniref:DUF2301 domain-containing membrane protein n=1 Tax=Vibrio sp. SS-MA-C1-2 TaxID=2908646 RepID=UPI001F3549F8|nr:DUF2301 domain-containing membrane protein [Vibrio sp. SS-MA-C1-2]UJF18329.1 DUF2301 domain-containing membrane protein [Vibrio sp. SS-MA-C1-2]
MADPHIKSQLDFIDLITVIFYRLALISAGGALILSYWMPDLSAIILIVSVVFSSRCLHIYNKFFRWLLDGAGIFATVLWISGLMPHLAIGAALFVYSGLAFKEYFCFRLKILLLIPIALIGYWFFSAINFSAIPNQIMVSTAFSIIGGGLLILCGIYKFKMPLHYDIGDKTAYQV